MIIWVNMYATFFYQVFHFWMDAFAESWIGYFKTVFSVQFLWELNCFDGWKAFLVQCILAGAVDQIRVFILLLLWILCSVKELWTLYFNRFHTSFINEWHLTLCTRFWKKNHKLSTWVLIDRWNSFASSVQRTKRKFRNSNRSDYKWNKSAPLANKTDVWIEWIGSEDWQFV